jgi:CBS domain-containing protein
MARVSELLGNRTDIYSLQEDMTVHEAARYLRERGVRATAVCNKAGKVVGVVSQSDISDKVAAENLSPNTIDVVGIMERHLIQVTPETGLEECLHLMDGHNIYHLLVVDDFGKYYGMISVQDLLRVTASDHKARADLLESWAFPPV